jgi:hypothetical protein
VSIGEGGIWGKYGQNMGVLYMFLGVGRQMGAVYDEFITQTIDGK